MLMFMKEKRDGTIKGRGCADGRKQRDKYSNSDTTSPTVSTEAVLITSVIDALEGRDVAVVDIPGAYLSAEMDDEVFMIFRGIMAELMVAADPKLYRKYISYDNNGKAILYVRVKKALYGCLKSALLFYEKLVKDLGAYGFEINPYDPCVANKMVNGKQLTITWHVDDLKISHVNRNVVSNTITWLESIYGEMHGSRGQRHEYLGMCLDFSVKGEVRVSMEKYLRGIIDDFPEEIRGIARTPASEHLFKVREDNKEILLSKTKARAFHHSVAQLLFSSMRCRKDTQTAVAFLTTRVRAPDEDDWKKLMQLLQYIRCTIRLPLILRADCINIIKWWVDASYAAHEDMRGHTGVSMSMGRGSIISMSKKQKINTKISTESELIGADDALPQMLWTKYFVESQGYKVNENIMYQDNMSAMLLEKNGKKSSTKNTKHINVRYFFIKDRIACGDVKIEHCPTKEMIGDHFTKPLQGELFRKFRAEIMNIPENAIMSDMDWDGIDLPKGVTWKLHGETDTDCPQECVGKYALGNDPPGVTGNDRTVSRVLSRDISGPNDPPGVTGNTRAVSRILSRGISGPSRVNSRTYAQVVNGK